MINNCDTLNIKSNKDLEIINKKFDTIGVLNVNGAINCNKGIKIGLSNKNVPGLMVFDGINFLGFNKNGWNLLSHNTIYQNIDETNIIYNVENNILHIIANIDDDNNIKYNIDKNNIDKNNFIDIDINIHLNKIDNYKINYLNILLNNYDDNYNNNNFNIYFFSKYHDIYYENKNIILKNSESILIHIIITDDSYYISFKNYQK